MSIVTRKPWGSEGILVQTEHFVLKRLFVKKGCRLSSQYHIEKKEAWYVESGLGFVEVGVNKERILLGDGVSLVIPNGVRHRITAETDLHILEVSTPELDDIVRLEDDYGRV